MAAANKSQSNGILPVTASQTSGGAPKPATSKSQVAKLKVLVRRLPPGLTENEFVSILGEDWKLGKGKVDWMRYKAGKDSKEYDILPSTGIFANLFPFIVLRSLRGLHGHICI
jgi:regulator of nonsense transcripts 3